MTYEEFVKDCIRNYMSERFFLEGESKDYFFGKSIWNDYLTVFYNDLGERTSVLERVLNQATNNSLSQLAKEIGQGGAYYGTDLAISAFNIPARIHYYGTNSNDNSLAVNVIKTNVLEEAIKKEPERWELYLKSRKD